ncbi:acyl-CoA dehydrogenase family protein [Nannocystis punicea]|uniref:Acyl-CoA dehydrogenase family protein n=1 Tax=Nannocystis punicea TaxID=2995304 RepID=A0ABY7H7K8_9BACT|nr:acyl-CoA dehydrogenase family protein [Nannocystis poenicansa]WAS95247.1 acyl-CoA dehydrogenase family protein [Nannocystis poenicansa]
MTTTAPSDSSEQATFRAHCKAWLAANLPPRPNFRLPLGPLEIATIEQLEYLCAWQKAAHSAGLVGCDYPREYGGGGLRDCQWIANHELKAAGAPFFPNIVGLGMAAPTIFHHGTEAQKRRLLAPLFAADEIWCQGFSEPGAGSDLANVQAFAERDGERWIVNGHKVWTTLAHFATWMILLCRTDRSRKYEGMTYFVAPIRDGVGRGVAIRPLVKMTGELGFNEVFFESYPIEDDLRLDEVGRGWAVAMTTLLHERGAGSLVTPSSGGGVGDDGETTLGAGGLIELAKRSHRNGRPASDDPRLRDAIVQMLIRQRAFAQNERRAAVPALVDHPLRLPLQHKLTLSELLQDTARLACEIEGMAATLHQTDPGAPAGGRWPHAYMNSYGFTIAAGSNEVQRNILGERVLGLAKSK